MKNMKKQKLSNLYLNVKLYTLVCDENIEKAETSRVTSKDEATAFGF